MVALSTFDAAAFAGFEAGFGVGVDLEALEAWATDAAGADAAWGADGWPTASGAAHGLGGIYREALVGGLAGLFVMAEAALGAATIGDALASLASVARWAWQVGAALDQTSLCGEAHGHPRCDVAAGEALVAELASCTSLDTVAKA